MSSLPAEKAETLLPSEFLNRQFDQVDPILLGGAAAEEEVGAIHTHAVRIGEIGLLLPADEISELVEQQTVCRLPNTAIWFHGVTSVRGSMVPVFDLHSLFDIESASETRRLIVVGEHETATAFWVDGYPGLVTVHEDDLTSDAPKIPSLIGEHARRYYLRDGQTWIDWDLDSFFKTLGDML